MNEEEYSSYFGASLNDFSSICQNDSNSNLSLMELDLWTFNSTNSAPNLYREGGNFVQTSNVNETKSYSIETNGMFADDLNVINSNSINTSYYEMKQNNQETDFSYSFDTVGKNQSFHNCFQANSLPSYPTNSRTTTSFSNVKPTYSSSSLNNTNNLAYSLRQGIPINSNHCNSSSSHTSNHFQSSPSNGHFSSSQANFFPTASMSVNLSMNMTMGFTADTQLQWPSQNVNYNVHSSNQSPTQSYYEPFYNPSYPPTSTSYTITAEFLPTSNSGLYPIQPSSPITEKSYNNLEFRYPYSKTKLGRDYTILQEISKNTEGTYSKMRPTNQISNLCQVCGKTYARPSTLKTHMRTHSGERPYRCITCHKSFSQAANLTAHIRTHNGEKPFCCPVCYRKFSQSSSVTTHMRTHSGERPYRCFVCKKAFSDSSTLTKHLRVHSGEKPYQCKLCLLRFSQSGNLNRHMRIHNYN